MFTGIVEETGTVLSISRGASEAKISVKAAKVMEGLSIGDSIAVNGVCLTAADIKGNSFTADVMNETFLRSSLAELKSGSHVNLERAMAANGRFGGHIVAGHVDGTGRITEVRKDGNAVRYKISAPPEIIKYIIEKGSVAVDGISLTVTDVSDRSFGISVIPHTVKETVLSEKQAGSVVNLENDIIGKYVERFVSAYTPENTKNGTLTMESLLKAGFI